MLLSCVFIAFAGDFYFLRSNKNAYKKSLDNCKLCDSDVISYQEIYNGIFCKALYSNKPLVDGHCLIIPKRHVVNFDELDEREMYEIGQIIKKVHFAVKKVFNTESYVVLQKNGWQAWQTIPHVHVHYIPRHDKDSLLVSFWQLFKRMLSPSIKPIEMNLRVNQLKREINSN